MDLQQEEAQLDQLQKKLAELQAMKRLTKSQLGVLAEDKKKLMLELHKCHQKKRKRQTTTSSQSQMPKPTRIETLLAQQAERERAAALQRREIAKRREEDAKRRQEEQKHAIETRAFDDDNELDRFLAEELL